MKRNAQSDNPPSTTGLSSIEPSDGGDEVDGREEVAVGFVVTGGESAKLLEPAEEIFDQVSGLVEFLVVVACGLASAFWRNDRGLAGLVKRLDHARVGIEGLVGDHDLGGQVGKQCISAVQIMSLPGREMEAGWIAERINGGIDLGAQSAFAAPDRLRAVFLSAPALC